MHTIHTRKFCIPDLFIRILIVIYSTLYLLNNKHIFPVFIIVFSSFFIPFYLDISSLFHHLPLSLSLPLALSPLLPSILSLSVHFFVLLLYFPTLHSSFFFVSYCNALFFLNSLTYNTYYSSSVTAFNSFLLYRYFITMRVTYRFRTHVSIISNKMCGIQSQNQCRMAKSYTWMTAQNREGWQLCELQRYHRSR